MFLMIGFGLVVYCAISFVFFALSAMELAESRRTGMVQLVAALVSAVVWPLTVLVMTAVLFIQKTKNA